MLILELKELNDIISEGKSRNLIVLEEHMDEIIKGVERFSSYVAIEIYECRFLFQFDKRYLKKGTYLLSIVQICIFDHELSAILEAEIIEIEKRLLGVMIKQICKYLNVRIFADQEAKLSQFNLTIKELITGDNKKIFLRLFNKYHTMIRKDIFRFLEYIAANHETIDTKLSVHRLFSKFAKKENKNVKKLKKTKKIILDILKSASTKNGLSQTETLLYLSLNIKEFLELYEDYCLNNILKTLANDGPVEDIMNKTIQEVSSDWTLGAKIEVFNCLNEDVKNTIIDSFFSGTDTKISKKEKAAIFVELLKLFKNIRNKCAHGDVVYDFCRKRDRENVMIFDFLKLNNFNRSISKNKINISDAIECIYLFIKNCSPNKALFKESISEAFNKINLDLLQEDVKLYLLNHYIHKQ